MFYYLYIYKIYLAKKSKINISNLYNSIYRLRIIKTLSKKNLKN